MSRTWTFSDLEFFVLWEEVDEDGLPSPLIFTSRTPGHDDFVLEKARARASLRARADHREIIEVLNTLAFPDIRVVVDAWGGADPDDPRACVRLLGGRKGDLGFIVKQMPGESIWHSGGFVVTECRAVDLATEIVAHMPDAPAGKRGEIALPDREDSEIDRGYGASPVKDDAGDHAVDRTRAFLEAPVSRAGVIVVAQGKSVFGPRGIVRSELAWRDLADDGRYAIVDGLPARAVGVDAARLVALVNPEIITVIKAIKDERV